MTQLGPLKALPERLKKSRDAKKLSMRKVADELSHNGVRLSHASIAKYEKGESVPTIKTLEALAKIYGKPLAWFLESGTPIANIAFRNLKSRVSAAEKRKYVADAQRWLEAYVKLENRLGQHLTPKIHLHEIESPQSLAMTVREKLGYDEKEPVPSVVDVLEKFGIRTMELATKVAIDGMACKFGDEFAVVLNPTTSYDRARMNAAHELGHVLLGDCNSEGSLIEIEAEALAYEFASHLLLPQSQLKDIFAVRSMVKLVTAKERFGISMQAMVFRASHGPEKLLDDRTAKWLWIQFAKRGWRKQEPGQVRPDRATRFERLFDTAISNKVMRWTETEGLLGVDRVELRERIDFAIHGWQTDTKQKGETADRDILTFPQ